MKKILQVIWFILKSTFIAFGGGNALMPYIRTLAVKKYKWVTDTEMDEIIITTNAIPGPNVVETLSYISMKVLGRTKGAIVALFAILPHIFFALGLYIIAIEYLPKEYLFVINVSVIPVIIGVLLSFFVRYWKISKKEIGLPLLIGLMILTCGFNIFIPTPWNIPAIIMVSVMLIVLTVNMIQTRRMEKK